MILLATTMGESILIETLRSAVYFLSHSANIPQHRRDRSLFQESKYCYFFIQGTGLDELIESYALDYDPDQIRNGFNFYVRHSV